MVVSTQSHDVLFKGSACAARATGETFTEASRRKWRGRRGKQAPAERQVPRPVHGRDQGAAVLRGHDAKLDGIPGQLLLVVPTQPGREMKTDLEAAGIPQRKPGEGEEVQSAPNHAAFMHKLLRRVRKGWPLTEKAPRLTPKGLRWRRRDSNPRPGHCERPALPTELRPQIVLAHPCVSEDRLYRVGARLQASNCGRCGSRMPPGDDWGGMPPVNWTHVRSFPTRFADPSGRRRWLVVGPFIARQ